VNWRRVLGKKGGRQRKKGRLSEKERRLGNGCGGKSDLSAVQKRKISRGRKKRGNREIHEEMLILVEEGSGKKKHGKP